MNTRQQQHGTVLFISLVMLLIFTIFALSAVNTSTINLRIVGNMQAQEEVKAAAQTAIEQLLGDATNFTTTPTASTTTTTNVDIDNDGTDDYTVTLVRSACLAEAPLAPSSYSIVADHMTWWDIAATVTDTDRTDAAITVHQGVRIPLAAAVACS